MGLRRMHVLLVLVLSASWLRVGATPSSAAEERVSVALEFGRTTLATVMFGSLVVDAPNSHGQDCPRGGGSHISSIFEDDEISMMNVDIRMPLVLPVFGGSYWLTTTGSSWSPRPPGTVGTWDPTTGVFSGVSMEVDFIVEPAGSNGCVEEEEEDLGMCRGTFFMDLSGTTRHQHPGGPAEGPTPWPEESDAAWINGATTRPFEMLPDDPCPDSYSLLLPHATLNLGVNPSDPAHGDDPGAEFR